MTTTPTVSIAMPAYNAEKYLPDAIESILAQTFSDWELIIADDGSTDGTAEIIRTYEERDCRIRSVRMPCNSGRCLEPRLAAVHAAKADLVMCVDADDVLDADLVEQALRRREKTGVEIVLPVMARFTGVPGGRPQFVVPASSFPLERVMKGMEAALLTIGHWKIAFIAALCPKALYLKTEKLLPASGARNLDEALTRILLDNAVSVAWIPARYWYRDTPGSVTHSPKVVESVALTNAAVLEYMRGRHGMDSEAALRAEAALFVSVIDMLYLPWPDLKTVAALRTQVRPHRIRHLVSRKHIAALRMGLRAASLIFRTYGHFKKR